jgi:glycosyltransferase involved in cell wall biosynthesis
LAAWCDLIYAHDLGVSLPGGRPLVYKVVGDQAWERAVNKGWVGPRTDVDAFQTARYGPLVSWFKWRRAVKVRRADRVIVPSAYLARLVQGWGAPAVQVIYNAIAPPVGLPAREAARAQLGLPAGETTLLYAGRLAAWKGVDYLIEAVRGLDGARLLVAGDGPMMPALSAAAGANVTMLGRLPREQVALYMRAADYTVLYSGYEGLPHVLLESLQAGTPVIASDKGGNPEVVQHEVNGLLVPWGDAGALAAAIRRVATAPGLREKLAAGCEEGMARFSWPRLVDETTAALEAVAHRQA